MVDRPLHVAIVSPYALDVPGGVQNHVRRLAEQLAATGDAVLVVGPGRGHLDLSVDVRVVGRPVSVAFNGSRAPICLDPRSIRRTRQALARFIPDVIHVHEPMVPFVGWAAARAARRGEVPVVATFHAFSSSDRLYRLARPALQRLDQKVAGRVAVSPAAAAYHAAALGRTVTDFTVVPNGIDAARFSGNSDTTTAATLPTPQATAGRSEGSERPRVLFVGRLERRKGARYLIEAIIQLRDQRDVELVIVGDGPDRSHCEKLVPHAHRHAVRFVGRVDNDALAAYYATADLFVAPSLGGESFGIVLLEAMAAGTAVVASDIPGYRAVLREGRLGVLVPPAESGALAEAIEQLMGDPQRRKALIDAGRRAAAACDWSVVAGRLRQIYLAASG